MQCIELLQACFKAEKSKSNRSLCSLFRRIFLERKTGNTG